MKRAIEDIQGLQIITPKKFGDNRGFFSETYNQKFLKAEHGIDEVFVQDNHSFSAEANTVRGLHFQINDFAQTKLLRVVRGAILDVAVDIRKGSPTYGDYAEVELSAENWQQIYIPKGFAHGFCTLEPNTEIVYKVDAFYSPENDRGIIWSDPDIAIDWPAEKKEIVLSERDTQHPALADLEDYFTFSG